MDWPGVYGLGRPRFLAPCTVRRGVQPGERSVIALLLQLKFNGRQLQRDQGAELFYTLLQTPQRFVNFVVAGRRQRLGPFNKEVRFRFRLVGDRAGQIFRCRDRQIQLDQHTRARHQSVRMCRLLRQEPV